MRYLVVGLACVLFPMQCMAQSAPSITADDAAQSAYAVAFSSFKREIEANAMVAHLSAEVAALQEQIKKLTPKAAPAPAANPEK